MYWEQSYKQKRLYSSITALEVSIYSQSSPFLYLYHQHMCSCLIWIIYSSYLFITRSHHSSPLTWLHCSDTGDRNRFQQLSAPAQVWTRDNDEVSLILTHAWLTALISQGNSLILVMLWESLSLHSSNNIIHVSLHLLFILFLFSFFLSI